MTFQEQQIRQYLLGDLTDLEEGELEVAYFRDPELLARVELVRDDLADDYAAMRLSAADREKFERRILATADGREQLAISRALHRAAAQAPPVTQRSRWRIDPVWLSLAALLPVAVAAFLAWRIISGPDDAADRAQTGQATVRTEPPAPSSSSTDAARAPNAAPNEPQRSGTSSNATAMTLATLILTTDLERSRGTAPTLLTSSGATHVDLIAPRAALGAGTTQARVESVEGTEVWSGPATIPERGAPDPRPRARLPVSVLPQGDYFFLIQSPGRTGTTDTPRYYFRVRVR